MHISVIICAYADERWDDLVAAVGSVEQQTLPAAQTVVVIDHNAALLRRAHLAFPSATVVENHETRGLSGARNSGIAAAHGEIIAFLDDDAIAAPDWLARLGAGYTDPHVLGVGGAIRPLWLAERPAWFPDEFEWVVGCTYRGVPEEQRAVQRLIGCNMSFRREVFATLGGFRSGIGRVGKRPVAGEETELSIRVRQRWPERALVYDPQARVAHRVPRSRAGWAYFRERCYCEGLSKAMISAQVGAGDGLQSERAYVSRVLPLGVLRGIVDTAFRWQPAGIARAGAIVAGLGITVAGYAVGSMTERWESARRASETRVMREEQTT